MESNFQPNPNCERCSLGPRIRSRRGHACIAASKLEPVQLLVVGENPGSQESYGNISFVSEASKLVKTLLEPTGVSHSFSYAARCAKPDRYDLSLAELEACRPYLVHDILATQPDVILALGNPSLKTLTGKSGVMSYRGAPQELRSEIREALQKAGYTKTLPKVLASVNQDYVYRTPKAYGLLEEDCLGATRLCRQIRGEVAIPDATWVDAAWTDIDWQQTLAWDIETTGLKYRESNFGIWLIGVDDGQGPVKILTKEQDYEKFATYIAVEPTKKVTFNGLSFDEPAMRTRYQMPRFRVDDVMLLGYLLDETMPHHTLDAYAIRWLGVAPWKDRKPRTKQNQQEISEFWARGPQSEQDWNELKQYNARDTKYTRDLWFSLWARLSPELQNLYTHLLVPAVQALVKATEQGLYLVPENIIPARGWTDDQMGKSLSVLNRVCEDLWLGFGFNPNSGKHIGRVLFDKLGEMPVGYSEKTKAPKTDAESLKTIRARSQKDEVVDFCGNLLEYKSAHKMAGFLNRYESLVEADGRLHPPYFFTSTETGRSSSWIHTIPRMPAIRRVVGAPQGRKLIVADLSQIELRLVAWASRDPEMLATYKEGKNGGDLHTTTAKHIVRMGRGLPRDAEIEFDPKGEHKPQRSLAKGVNFGCVYGAEAFTIRDYLWKVFGIKVTFKEAETLRDDIFFGTYSGLIPWYQEIITKLKDDKQVVSPLGRIRRLANIDASDIETRAEAARQGINTYIQSLGSDLAVTSFFLIEQHYDWLQPVMFHHDADLFECDEDRAEEGAKIVQHYMEVEALDYLKQHFGFEIDVPIVSEVAIMQDWSK